MAKVMQAVVGTDMRTRGFTLIELLVTIAVAVILATVAVPGFQNMMVSSRLSSDYNQVLSGLNLARSEAIKRREKIEFTIEKSSAPWKYRVVRSTVDPSVDLRVRESGNNEVTLASDGGKLVFDSLGKSNCDDGCEIKVKESTKDVCRAISISSFGRVGREEKCS